MTLEETIIRYAGKSSVAQPDVYHVTVALNMGMMAIEDGALVPTLDGFNHCTRIGRLLLVLGAECDNYGPPVLAVAEG